ncbi:MFS transporter [Actinokineospora terrae]|uniref:Major Facilitator Superfamily protein n=1 Tax=Actinokineospora terrae TaxID=155974 RepID=A0A1H9WT06_9PSEU|nr:Major Facilitator Superfamily protein [Actinokineospora terrae]
MYLRELPRGAARSAASRVPSTVLALGVVSLLTDISAEMVTAFLPMYLVYGLGAGYLHLGLVDGLHTGATALLRLAGGHIADRTGRPKAVALVGYGLSAVTKLGFPAAGSSLPLIGGLLAVDRAGKGIRTGPRDAMITFASPAGQLGRAFGVHRMLDAVGALLGPVVAFTLIALAAPDSVFVVSFGFAAAGVLVLATWVRDPGGRVQRVQGAGERQVQRDPVGDHVVPELGGERAVGLAGRLDAGDGEAAVTGAVPLRPERLDLRALLRPEYRRVTVLAVLLGFTTVSDAFLFLAAQQRTGVDPGWLPLLPVGVAVTFLTCAVPVGRLADRFGRWRVFLLGHLLLLVVYGLLLVGGQWPVLLVALGLHGLFYAATDGVLMACVGALVPEEQTAGGLAVVQTAQALARTCAALGLGRWRLRLGWVCRLCALGSGSLWRSWWLGGCGDVWSCLACGSGGCGAAVMDQAGRVLVREVGVGLSAWACQMRAGFRWVGVGGGCREVEVCGEEALRCGGHGRGGGGDGGVCGGVRRVERRGGPHGVGLVAVCGQRPGRAGAIG